MTMVALQTNTVGTHRFGASEAIQEGLDGAHLPSWPAFLATLPTRHGSGMCGTSLPCSPSLGALGSQTLSAIIGNRAVNDGAAIDAFPSIKHEKEIRKPL